MAAAGEASGGRDKYRSFMYGEGEKDTVWRLGSPPNYDVVNKLFEEERTKEWPEGSLEEKVQRLLKTWEMELVHKVRPEDQKSVDEEMKVEKTEYFYERGNFLASFLSTPAAAASAAAEAASGSGCPILVSDKKWRILLKEEDQELLGGWCEAIRIKLNQVRPHVLPA
uniref:Uncharacterized protein n=1 Tax=Oryza barthii TaxID=65489 RepID=A0A0D3ELR4_9ORYZ